VTYRIIYELRFQLETEPADSPEATAFVNVQLNVHGNYSGNGRNSRIRNKHRTIDARVGDEVMIGGRWKKILAITTERENWCTDEDAESGRPMGGFAYKLRGESRIPQEIRDAVKAS
jgi:hypothetical protein